MVSAAKYDGALEYINSVVDGCYPAVLNDRLRCADCHFELAHCHCVSWQLALLLLK